MYELTIPAMSCAHCQKTITGALLALDGNATMNFDMAAHKVTLDTAAELGEVKDALDGAGYPVEAVEQKNADGGNKAGGGCHCDMCD